MFSDHLPGFSVLELWNVFAMNMLGPKISIIAIKERELGLALRIAQSLEEFDNQGQLDST